MSSPEELDAGSTVVEQSLDSFIEHADRMWEAESEVARRHVQRSNLLFSVMAALFGLGLFKIEWSRRADEVARISNHCMECGIRLLLLAGLICLAVAFWLLVRGPRHSRPPASQQLELDPDLIDQLPQSPEEAKRIIFARTYLAALELGRQNAEKNGRISTAQAWLILGLGIVFVALILFTLATMNGER